MNPDEYLALAPVLLTGLFAFAGTWAGSRFSHVNEHNQWLRNEKLQACSHFVSRTEAQTAANLWDADPSDLQAFSKEVSELSEAKMKLLCSLEVVDAASKLKDALGDKAAAALAFHGAGADKQDESKLRLRDVIAVAEHRYSYLILESSNDLISGRFHGLGPFRPTLMPMLRLRSKVEERRRGSVTDVR
ncbi:hypothetical protein [Arthrobacter sp. NPDC056727]|uniref:hypothetical protein n=1 Tax=Arthrobacter sp. NPDC056727 TaxID=3345927 RepID=UPI003671DEC2